MIRLLLADERVERRASLADALGAEDDMVVVAEVGLGTDVVAAAREARADICLVGAALPDLDGPGVTAALGEALPRVRTVVMTAAAGTGHLRRVLDAGAAGFVVQDSASGDMASALRKVHAGLRVVDPTLAVASLAPTENPLSEREQELLRLVLRGSSVASIAKTLHLSPGTIRNHLSAAVGRTRTPNRDAAAQLAHERGWL